MGWGRWPCKFCHSLGLKCHEFLWNMKSWKRTAVIRNYCMNFQISSSSQEPESVRQLPKYRCILVLQLPQNSEGPGLSAVTLNLQFLPSETATKSE